MSTGTPPMEVPETQVGAEINRLSGAVEKADSVFESLRLGISPILRVDEPNPKGTAEDEAELTVPRAREIQSIRIRLEGLIRHIAATSGLSEA